MTPFGSSDCQARTRIGAGNNGSVPVNKPVVDEPSSQMFPNVLSVEQQKNLQLDEAAGYVVKELQTHAEQITHFRDVHKKFRDARPVKSRINGDPLLSNQEKWGLRYLGGNRTERAERVKKYEGLERELADVTKTLLNKYRDHYGGHRGRGEAKLIAICYALIFGQDFGFNRDVGGKCKINMEKFECFYHAVTGSYLYALGKTRGYVEHAYCAQNDSGQWEFFVSDEGRCEKQQSNFFGLKKDGGYGTVVQMFTQNDFGMESSDFVNVLDSKIRNFKTSKEKAHSAGSVVKDESLASISTREANKDKESPVLVVPLSIPKNLKPEANVRNVKTSKYVSDLSLNAVSATEKKIAEKNRLLDMFAGKAVSGFSTTNSQQVMYFRAAIAEIKKARFSHDYLEFTRQRFIKQFNENKLLLAKATKAMLEENRGERSDSDNSPLSFARDSRGELKFIAICYALIFGEDHGGIESDNVDARRINLHLFEDFYHTVTGSLLEDDIKKYGYVEHSYFAKNENDQWEFYVSNINRHKVKRSLYLRALITKDGGYGTVVPMLIEEN
ncbi:MAG: hypothetical protein V4591_08405 [Bdellovibrionota bacterium]